MSREQIRRLISAIQRRVPPPDRLPPLEPRVGLVAAESSTRIVADDVIPPDWKRPQPPGWLPGEAPRAPDDVVPLGPDDEISIAQEDGAPPIISEEGTVSSRDQASELPTPSFDVLAYYLPFHFYRNSWGIYIQESGILQLTSCIVGQDFLGWDETWIVDLAAKCLFLHEFFHHSVEVACARLEYPLPAARLGNDHYTPYFNDSPASYLEEAVANAYVARNIDRYYQNSSSARAYASVKKSLLAAMERQPEPYNKFRYYVGSKRYAGGRDLLVDEMYRSWLPGSPPPSNILGSAIYFADVTPAATYCPTYLVLNAANHLLRVGKPFPKIGGLQVIVHSRDHPPPHIHVRELNRGLEIRYLWPSLKPYEKEMKFSARTEKSLREYVAQYHSGISERVSQTYPDL